MFVDPNRQYMAAFPDGMFSCACHGDAVTEVKCPFKIRKKTEKDPATQKLRIKRS